MAAVSSRNPEKTEIGLIDVFLWRAISDPAGTGTPDSIRPMVQIPYRSVSATYRT